MIPHHEAIKMQQIQRKRGWRRYSFGIPTYDIQVDAKDPAEAQKKVTKYLVKQGVAHSHYAGRVVEHKFYTTCPTDFKYWIVGNKRSTNSTTAKMRRLR